MVERLLRLGDECVALVGRLEEGDGVLYAESNIAVRIGDGGEGKVGKGEVCSTLTYACCVKMTILHLHFRAGETFAYFSESYAVGGGIAVALIEEILNVFHNN